MEAVILFYVFGFKSHLQNEIHSRVFSYFPTDTLNQIRARMDEILHSEEGIQIATTFSEQNFLSKYVDVWYRGLYLPTIEAKDADQITGFALLSSIDHLDPNRE